MKALFFIATATLMPSFALAKGPQWRDAVYGFETDKPSYGLGEPLHLTVLLDFPATCERVIGEYQMFPSVNECLQFIEDTLEREAAAGYPPVLRFVHASQTWDDENALFTVSLGPCEEDPGSFCGSHTLSESLMVGRFYPVTSLAFADPRLLDDPIARDGLAITLTPGESDPNTGGVEGQVEADGLDADQPNTGSGCSVGIAHTPTRVSILSLLLALTLFMTARGTRSRARVQM